MIEVGEYVRLDNGKIGKVIAIEKGSIMLDIVGDRWIGLCCISNHSKNIIDLITKGDYVNGTGIYEMGQTENKEKWIHSINGFLYFNKDIESIVTKEQMASMEYKVV